MEPFLLKRVLRLVVFWKRQSLTRVQSISQDTHSCRNKISHKGLEQTGHEHQKYLVTKQEGKQQVIIFKLRFYFQPVKSIHILIVLCISSSLCCKLILSSRWYWRHSMSVIRTNPGLTSWYLLYHLRYCCWQCHKLIFRLYWSNIARDNGYLWSWWDYNIEPWGRHRSVRGRPIDACGLLWQQMFIT